MTRCKLLSLCVLCLIAAHSPADDPCRSGPQPGQRPGPYACVQCTGPQRGQSHCYICEAGDRPAVVVFARGLTEPLGKLVGQLDKSLIQHKAADLRGWVTILHPDQSALDPKVIDWGKKHAIRAMPLGVFEDAGGPPSYRIARDADVTVLLFVKQKVVANFAFRTGELNDEKVKEVVAAVPRIIAEKK